MKKALVTTLLLMVFMALWQAVTFSLPRWLNVMFMPPIILCFIMQYFKPIEAIFVCLFCGAIVDVAGGFSIGINMVLMLLWYFLLGAANIVSGRISRLELSSYAAILSFMYRLSLLIVESTLVGQKNNIYFSHFLFGPMMDWISSVIFYFLLFNVLLLMKAIDLGDSGRSNLGAYP